MDSNEVIGVFREAGAVLEGHFILTSGLRSPVFLQKARVFMHADKTERLCKALAAKIRAEVPGRIDYVVGPAVGGLIPGTMFATAPFYAPAPAAVSTTVGLMQQGSGVGQILLPPVVAALAQYTGSWSSTWMATGVAAMITVAIALAMARYDRARLRYVRQPGRA